MPTRPEVSVPSASAGAAIAVDVQALGNGLLKMRIGTGTSPGLSYLDRDPAEAIETPSQEQPALRAEAHGERLTVHDRLGKPLLRLILPRCEAGAGRTRLAFELVGEQHLYGLGQGGQPFDRLGAARRLWNCHVNHGGGGDIAIPLLVSQRGYALFFDNAAPATCDAGHSYDDLELGYEVADGGVDFYIVMGATLRATMGQAALLLGRAPMPPRWALGYLQSTRHFRDAAEIRALAGEFRDRDLPCDAIVFLSSYGRDRGWNRGVGHLEPEASLFADAAGLVADLHAQGIRVMLHEYPVLHPHSPLHEEAVTQDRLLDECYPEPVAGDQPPANWHQGQRYIDFNRREVGAWWWSKHRHLVDLGIDGWWLDGGEGPVASPAIHNRYDLDRQAAFAAGERQARPERRPFLLCRSGGPGMQRFGAACWSGDVNNSFATLEAQIGLGLNVGMSGVPYWGTDIGGYYPTAPESMELFVRWFQFGAFTPIFRAHGRNWRLRLPWSFGEEAVSICRRYLELRYALMPYTYTLAWQAYRLGLPLMRPLVLDHAEDPQSWDQASSYLWGDDILVSPVTRGGARHWPVALPQGRWLDFWTGAVFEGGGSIEVEAPLDRLPLFLREGAIVPMAAVQPHATRANPEHLTLRVFPGGDRRFDLFEDDGETYAYETGGFAVTRFTLADQGAAWRFTVEAPQGDGALLPQGRCYTLEVHAPNAPRDVRLDGAACAWRHDGRHTLSVDIPRHSHVVEVLR